MLKILQIIKKYIGEILQPFPRLRFLIKKVYKISIFCFFKLVALFYHSGHNFLKESNVTNITNKKYHYFFGYYDKCPWNNTGKYLLCLKTSFANRMPKPGESAEIYYIDLNKKKNTMYKIAETKAWCWQQGCMLQWFKSKNEDLIIYNDFRDNEYVSVISDLKGKVKKILPLPIYTITEDGKQALGLNFGRLHYGSAGYGYITKPYLDFKKLCPRNDGIWHINIDSNKYKLIVSLRQIYEFDFKKNIKNAFHYFNHLKFNPNGTRFVFLHRWNYKGGWHPEGRNFTRMFTANIDGSDLYCLSDYEMVSHFTWKDNEHILAWARQPINKNHFYLFKDKTKDVKIIGKNILLEDGHPSYSPDGRWILLDTYPNKIRLRKLLLYDTFNSRIIEIGNYFTSFKYEGVLRCDLHPRWSNDGKKICFDSTHEGIKRIYVMDVSSIVEA